MPSKYALKLYVENGFYHVFNRGIEKRNIFTEDSDYRYFLYLLKSYLLPREIVIDRIKNNFHLSEEDKAREIIKISNDKNFFNKIDLICFVLMPNHYHLFLRQKGKNDMEIFMKSLNTRYVMFFNKKYQRTGHLFEGRYKAILVDKEEYFLHLSRYIHLNPLDILSNKEKLSHYPWSSYSAYLRDQKLQWVKKDLILSYFHKVKGFNFSSYQGFVEGYKETDKERTFYKKYLVDL